MATYMDINNYASLKGIIDAINTYNINQQTQRSTYFSVVDRIFDFFPFSALMDNRNQEALSLLLQILRCFLDNNKFISNPNNCIVLTLEFVLTNLVYLSNDEYELLKEFLGYLSCLLLRIRYLVKQLNIVVNPERICSIIDQISKDSPVLKKDCIAVLIELFSINDLFYSAADIFESCVTRYYREYVEEIKFTDLCKLATSVLSIKPGPPISRSNFLYYWIEQKGPKLLELLKDELEIYEFLKCLALAFETKDYNYTTLTKRYLPKIFILEEYLKNKTLSETAMAIVIVILNDLLHENVIPSFECDEPFLTESHKGDYVLNFDLQIIINYLKALHARFSLNQGELSTIITRRSFSSKPFSPATLKAICHLYPMYVRDIEPSEQLNNVIISAVQKYPDLQQLITYEPEQLRWFQHHGNNLLKLKSIYLWLLNGGNNQLFMEVLESTKTYHLLISFIVNKYEDSIKRRASEIISSFNSPQISIVLMRNIPKTIGYTKSLGYLLLANPAIPQTEERGLFFCRMMADILPGLTDMDAFSGGCYYSRKLLMQFKNKPVVVQAFFSNTACLLNIYRASASSSDVSENSMRLLELLMKLQKRHEFKALQPVNIDFTKLLTGRDVNQIKKSLFLMQLSLRTNPSYSVIRMSSTFEDVLSQYLCLHDIEDDGLILRILETLMIFVKKYNYLAHSSITAVFIKIQCTRITDCDDVAMFLLFLKEVTRIVSNQKFRKIPINEMVKFLFKHKDQHNVDDLWTMLQTLSH